MAEIIMPKMGDAMTEGKVVRWYKQPGDAVKKGEPVLEIETDKVNLDLEAEADGPLGEHQAKEGEMVPIGGGLATIGGEPSPATAAARQDTAPSAPKDTSPAAPKDTPPAEEPQRRAIDRKDSIKHTTGEYAEAIEMKGPRVDRSSAPPNDVLTPQSESGWPRSSPLARRIARDMGVSIEQVHGSGPGGRVVASDVKSLGGQTSAQSSLASAQAPKAIPLGLPVP